MEQSLQCIRQGSAPEVAFSRHGVPGYIVRQFLTRGEAEKSHRQNGGAPNFREDEFVGFCTRVESAQAFCQSQLAQSLFRIATSNERTAAHAALSMLERMAPEAWGKKNEHFLYAMNKGPDRAPTLAESKSLMDKLVGRPQQPKLRLLAGGNDDGDL